MKRLIHADETRRRDTRKRIGLGAALAIAGLMGVAACATTQVPRYSLNLGDSVQMRVSDTDVHAWRLSEPISAMERADAPHWIEEREGGGYRSMLFLSGGDLQLFGAAAFIENDGRWYFTGIVKQYGIWLRALRGENAIPPGHMELLDQNGICKMDAEPFRSLVHRISGREVARMMPISQALGTTDSSGRAVMRYQVHMLPLDMDGNRIGQYRGGQLALTSSYIPFSPEMGCGRGITLLVEPGVEDPRNLQK
ncbi:MAG: hypothetical protein V1861_02260 [Candidatus Micrarchaeota archaeon]